MQKRMQYVGALLVALVLTSGCGTVTRVTSNPSGAAVSINGRYVGTTPSSVRVPEYWDWFSKYSFTADKPGYHPQTIICQEDLFQGAAQCVPSNIHFDLVPLGENAVPKSATAPSGD